MRTLLRGLVGVVACMLWLAGTPAEAQTAARFVVDAGHSVRVGSIRFSPDGRYMASHDFTGKIVVRDLRSGAPVAELQGDEGYMTMGGGRLGGAMDFSPDGRWFALGTTDEATLEGRVSLRAVGSLDGSSHRPYLRDPAEQRPSGLPDLRRSCQRADGSGLALPLGGAGVVTWTAGGTPGPVVAVQPPPVGKDDMLALYCMAGAPGAWLVVGRDVKDAPGQPKIWLSDKTLYSWMPGQRQWQPVQHLGAVGLNSAAAVPGSGDLMAALNNRLWRFRPGVAGPVATLPTSAGRIETIWPTDDDGQLSVTAVYSIFLGGEYTPEIYPDSTHVLDLRTGRQVKWSDSADCGRLGEVRAVCASYEQGSAGGRSDPAMPMPTVLAAMGLAQKNVIHSTQDRLIAKQTVPFGQGTRTRHWWHDRATGQTRSFDLPVPDESEFSDGQWLSPDLDWMTVGLGADGQPAWASDVRRIVLLRLADDRAGGRCAIVHHRGGRGRTGAEL